MPAQWRPLPPCPEVGKIDLKSNGDEALSDESPLKTNGNASVKRRFSFKITVMKRLRLSKKS
jgi:hypothetical protein